MGGRIDGEGVNVGDFSNLADFRQVLRQRKFAATAAETPPTFFDISAPVRWGWLVGGG